MNIQDWIPLGLTGLSSLLSKGLLQHHSSKASILQCSAYFMVQLSYPYIWFINWTESNWWQTTHWLFIRAPFFSNEVKLSCWLGRQILGHTWSWSWNFLEIMPMAPPHSHFPSRLSSFFPVSQDPDLLLRMILFEIMVLSKLLTWSLIILNCVPETPPDEGNPNSSQAKTTKGATSKVAQKLEEPSPQNLLPN